MTAGKDEIRKWYIEGAERGNKYMLVVCDRMDYSDEPDSPYYAENEEAARELLRSFSHDEMSEVMEVYDLTADMDAQLAEKRAWHLPGGPEGPDAVFEAAGLLLSGETRLAFMEIKNAEYIKEFFGGRGDVISYPVYVFTDDSRAYVHDICVYFLEQKDETAATIAAVYRFTADGGARAYDTLLAERDEDDENDHLFPLPRHHYADADDPYVTFSVSYATGKDKYSDAYTQWGHTETMRFSEDYEHLGIGSGSSSPHVDKNSHKLYQRAMEMLDGKRGPFEEMMDLLHEAADEGHAGAMFALGKCYGTPGGSGLVLNAEKSAYWYGRAALLGHEEAKARTAAIPPVCDNEAYEQTVRYDELNLVAAKKDGKWGFVGQPESFIYKDIRWHWGSLMGEREDGTLDNFGRYYSH